MNFNVKSNELQLPNIQIQTGCLNVLFSIKTTKLHSKENEKESMRKVQSSFVHENSSHWATFYQRMSTFSNKVKKDHWWPTGDKIIDMEKCSDLVTVMVT